MKYVLISAVAFFPWIPSLINLGNLQWAMTWNNENTFFGLLLLLIPAFCLYATARKRIYRASLAVSCVLLINAYVGIHDAMVAGLDASSKGDVNELQMTRYFTHGVWGKF